MNEPSISEAESASRGAGAIHLMCLAGACAQWDTDWREPVVAVWPRAGKNRKEFFLQRFGDGTARAFADLNAID